MYTSLNIRKGSIRYDGSYLQIDACNLQLHQQLSKVCDELAALEKS